MRVPCYILIGTDPQTGAVVPTAVNEDYASIKKVREETVEMLEMAAITLSAAQKRELADTIKTLRIVTGVVEIDLED